MRAFFIPLLFLFSFSVVADRRLDRPFDPQDPVVYGQGGSFTATTWGYQSLFTNPAGFAIAPPPRSNKSQKEHRGELTFLSINGDIGINLSDFLSNQDDILGYVVEELPNGARIATYPGIAWVGEGLGIGVFSFGDIYIPRSATPLGTRADVDFGITLIVGYAHKFEFPSLNFLKFLSVGADFRPGYKMKGYNVDIGSVVDGEADEEDISFSDTILDSLNYAGFMLAFDIGVIAAFPMSKVGISIRDIGFNAFREVDDDGKYKEKLDKPFVTPTTLRVGVAFEPEELDFVRVVYPKVHLEIEQPLINDSDVINYTVPNFLTRLNVGVEVGFLGSMLFVRAGFHGGMPTLGIGGNFFVGELNLALYGSELGRYPGDTPVINNVFELAFRKRI